MLEIGVGPGVGIARAGRLVGDGQVVGVDHSATVLRQAERRNAAAIRQGRVALFLGSVSSLPAVEGPFDRIFSVNSIDFWDEPLRQLRRLRALLRPGGRIAITVQPRSRGATDATSARAGARLVAWLEAAGFQQVRLEKLPMIPVAAVCALGTAPLLFRPSRR